MNTYINTHIWIFMEICLLFVFYIYISKKSSTSLLFSFPITTTQSFFFFVCFFTSILCTLLEPSYLLSQVWLGGALSGWFLCSYDISWLIFFVCLLVLVWFWSQNKCFMLTLYFPCCRFRKGISLTSSIFLYLRRGI